MELNFTGIHAQIMQDKTEELDIEGSLNCGKTTMAVYWQLQKLYDHPGMWAFAFRYSDDATKTKLQPLIRLVAQIRGQEVKWVDKEMYFELSNESRLYSFGLKSVDQLSRYSKLRGLGVSDIYCDQAEELPEDYAGELRARLRPDLRMTLLKKEYPRQLVLTPNPPNKRHWLARDYPIDNSIPGRKYYRISIYDNEHNIGAKAVKALESSYPPGHARHATMVLGQRGETVLGDPVFEEAFVRKLHIQPVSYNPDDLLYEAFDLGKHNPCWLVAQRNFTGGWTYLGGVIGQDLFLEDFIPIVKQCRQDWFGGADPKKFRTTAVRGSQITVTTRYTDLNIVRDAGFDVESREHGNAPDVMLAMIELLAGYMRRRDAKGQECFRVNADDSRWLEASKEGVQSAPFFAHALESSCVWDPHFVSVGNKQVRRIKDDDWFEHPVKCAIAMELTFGADNLSPEQRMRQMLSNKTLPVLGRQSGPSTGWML